MDAKSTFLQSSDTDSIEDHETDQGTLLFITFLRKLNLFKYDWIPLAGVLSRRGPQQCTSPVGTREQVNLSNNTLLEKTTDPVDEAAETELLVSCEKKAGANREKLPDVVCEASSFLNTTAMSSQKADTKHCLKRTVSFQESSTRPALKKAQNFDEGGGDTGCATATARRRARSSGYYTGNSRDSDVGAPNDAEDDVFPPHRDERSSSRDEVCEDGEHLASEDVESVRISSDSSTSSFMISPSAEFPDFSALGVEEEAPGVGEWEPPQVGQLQPQGLGHLQPPGVQQFLRAEEFVETVLGSSDPDPVLADDDALMATYGRELQEEKIRRMMWQGVSLETMEEDITNQLPAEIDLSPANTGPVNQPTENPSASSVDQDICHRLQMAAQCDLPECDFLPCIQGQQELTAVTMYLETLQVVPSCVEIEKQKLRYLLDHATSCEDELRCTVPWCHFIFVFSLEHGIELDRLEQCLHEKYYTGHRDVFSHSTEQCDLIQLQHDVPHQRPSYEVLARLAPYKDVFLVIDLIASLTSRPAYFVIKQLSPVSSLDEQEELLRRLRHPHIVTHHWLLKPLRNTVFICTQFHGDSVRDWLRRSHPNGCGSTRHIWTILTQVLSAVEYLHSLSILYLAWTGSDVVLGSACDDNIDAKLSDFSHAVSMGGELSKEHEECLRQQLLPAIVPPEETLSLTHSDQWGVGCLLYEIALGYKVHRAYVHDGPERQRQQIGETRMPDLTDLDRVDPAVASVVISCLQLQVEKRPTIKRLQQFLPHI